MQDSNKPRNTSLRLRKSSLRPLLGTEIATARGGAPNLSVVHQQTVCGHASMENLCGK